MFSAQDMYALQDFKSSPAETIKAALAAGTDVACSPGVELPVCPQKNQVMRSFGFVSALPVAWVICNSLG